MVFSELINGLILRKRLTSVYKVRPVTLWCDWRSFVTIAMSLFSSARMIDIFFEKKTIMYSNFESIKPLL